MTKFKCITQTIDMNWYRGPSGERYSSYIGRVFEVKDKGDIAYFSKFPKRFLKINLKGKLTGKDKDTPQRDVDVLLLDELRNKVGLPLNVSKELVTKYTSREFLESAIDGGERFDELSEKYRDRLMKYFEKPRDPEGSEEPGPPEDPVEGDV